MRQGRAQSLLRRPGWTHFRGSARQRPAAVRRVAILLTCGLVAGALASPAAADQTTTDPAPDPNPPSGAAPDPYHPPAVQPKSKPAAPVVHSAPVALHRVYSAPQPARPAVTTRAARPPRSVRHTVRKRHKHVAAPKRPSPVRITRAAATSVAALARTVSAGFVVPADGNAGDRRRAAGLALTVLLAASLSLIVLTRRVARIRGLR